MKLMRPTRWTPRSLVSLLAPHLFRRMKNPSETTDGGAWRKERVPLDAPEIKFARTFAYSKLQKNSITQLRLKDGSRKRRTVWSVATGEHVESEGMNMAHVYHDSLGAIVEADILGTRCYRTPANILFLPRPITEAFDEWAITIVPQQVQDAMPGYQWTVLDPRHPKLQQPLARSNSTRIVTGLDLDNAPLHFPRVGYSRPPPQPLLYFHACCAIWKMTCVTNPACDAPDVLFEHFHAAMVKLWGRAAVDKSSVTRLFDPKSSDRDKFRSARHPVGFDGNITDNIRPVRANRDNEWSKPTEAYVAPEKSTQLVRRVHV